MNISSTPFIRNDYWPDYNDINQLNQRINEVENELSLTNIRLSTNIENVSNGLNSYANNQANTTIANNIIVNNINANYAVGKFVNFGNANFDNAYVENLTVNKPVFDITLNTPHIENVTSLGGNIYDANMFNVGITGGNVAFNNASFEDLTAGNTTIATVNILDGNVNLTKAVIGDINASTATVTNINILGGSAILNTVNTDTLTVNSPVSDITLNSPHIENATSNGSNIYDASILNVNIVGGTAALNDTNTENLSAVNATITNINILGGNINLTKAVIDDINVSNALISNVNILDGDVNLNKAIINKVNASNATIANLFVNTQPEPITSSAVLGYDSEGRVIPIHASYDVGFPEDANYLFTDHAGTAFAGVAATEVSAVNNLITAQAVQNGFNGINNTFNDVNANVQNGFNGINNTFNDVNANVQNGFNSIQYSLDQLVNVLIPPSSYSNAKYWNVVDASLPNTFSSIRYTTPVNTTGYNISTGSANPVYVRAVGRSPDSWLEFSSDLQVIDILSQRIFNNSIDNIFYNCGMFNQNITIPNSVTSAMYAFHGCTSLNQNILIPSSVSSVIGMFENCTSLNQNILLNDDLRYIENMFNGCTSLNQNILIPNNARFIENMFNGCTSLNQNILIPNNVSSIENMFNGCTSLNQNIYIYTNKDTIIMANAFKGCSLLSDKYIHIRSSIPMSTSSSVYNSLVNNITGVNWTGRILNDLANPTQWPPV